MIPGTPSLVGKTSCLLLPLCCPSPPKYTNRTRLSQMVLTAENSNGPTVRPGARGLAHGGWN